MSRDWPQHRSPQAHGVHVTLAGQGGILPLELRQDMDDPTYYWVYFESYPTLGNEIGHIRIAPQDLSTA
jgi:hypothetical protein